MALRLGDDTAYRGGQVTLDPTPHIRRAPIGMVVVPILSYLLGGWMIGWASAPYDPAWAARHPKHAATMSLAGPLANLLIVLLAALAIHVGMHFHYFQPPEHTNFSRVVDTYDVRNDMQYFASSFLSIAFSLNLLLFTFNLLPLPPLDGSGVLMYFVKEESAEHYMQILRHPTLAMFGIFIAWKVYGMMFPSIHLFAINLLYPGYHYEPT